MKKRVNIIDRNKNILEAAHWCFLNFGYSKTSMENVAKRANVSRALIYKKFKNKEEIALSIFDDMTAAGLPAAIEIAGSRKSKEERLAEICKVMIIDQWAEIEGAPMAEEFFKVCESIEPAACKKHEKAMLECVEKVLGTKELSELFVLSVYGLQSDFPTVSILRKRTELLIKLFITGHCSSPRETVRK